MIGMMELLIMAAVCLIPIVLVLLAAVAVLAVMVFKKDDRRPVAGGTPTSEEGDTNGQSG